MNQHLTYFSIAGARKYDYPPTFDYHEPWWQYYKYINDHYARLSMALSSGRQINDILILEPTTSAWLFDSYVTRNQKYAEIGQAFQTFVTTLEKNQVEYDLGSENIIKDLGSVKAGKFIVGQGSYSTVVLPPMMENLNEATFSLIKRFVAGGGKLVCFTAPSLIDGAQNESLQQFLKAYGDRIHFESGLNAEVISKYFSNPDFGFQFVKGGALYHQRRILSDGQLVFLVNSSLDDYVNGIIKIKGADAIEMNTITGEINGYQCTKEGADLKIAFDIPAAGSLLLYIPSVKQGNFEIPVNVPGYKGISSDEEMVITRDAENALTIEFCDLQLGDELTKDLHTFNAADKVYKYYGFKNGNPWNTSVQFKTQTVDRDKFDANTGFTATYHFNIKGNVDFSGMKAVVERPYLWSVLVNGKEVKAEAGKWWLDREFGIFSIEKLVKKGDNTITLIVSPMKIHAEIEPVYILGNFAVKPAEKGWTVEPAVNKLTKGSWKDQGMPFYSWGVTYSKKYNIEKPEGKYSAGVYEWKGTIAEVKVNDQPAGFLAFPPYQCDVTGFIKAGENKIEIKVIGSLKNLLGPHFNNPAPGLVGPWHFRNVKSYPSGKDYRLLDYGLMREIGLAQQK
jgi:hypothetical protein